MAERDLSGQPEQDVEADADDRREADQRDDEQLIAVGAHHEIGDRRERDRRRDEVARAHTLRASARPNSPLGRTTSATITSVKVTICV